MSNHSKVAMPIQRRTFLQAIALLGGSIVGGKQALALLQIDEKQSADIKRILGKFRLSADQSLRKKPIGEVMTVIGKSFIGTPYIANTLETRGEECLVVNLAGVDCVTFVESTLALSRCIKAERETVDDFKHQLQLIRYRSGNIQGYASRLHYFSDWIFDNTHKKIVRDIAEEMGGIPYTKTINFMLTHRSAYPQLVNHEVLMKMEEIEEALNSRKRYFLPKEKLKEVEQEIHDGDVLAITTTVQGLDVSHTGMALRVNGRLHFLHAPISGEAVQISSKLFVDYLNASAKYTGVMVARPLEPAQE